MALIPQTRTVQRMWVWYPSVVIASSKDYLVQFVSWIRSHHPVLRTSIMLLPGKHTSLGRLESPP